MWIRSANPPTLRMDFLGSIAEPKKSPVWYLSSTNSCDYQISFWCTICLNTVCQYSQQIGSCSLPPSCLMTHMFQICFTICFIGISQALQVGSEWHHMTSHELFRQPPPWAVPSLTSWWWKIGVKTCRPKTKESSCNTRIPSKIKLTKSWPGWAAIWKEPFILPSGSFLLSYLSPRSPVCINHCGQQPSEFFLRSFKRMCIHIQHTSVTNRIDTVQLEEILQHLPGM